MLDHSCQVRATNLIGVSGIAARRQGLAGEIRGLLNEWASNTLALGKKLKEARDTFPSLNKSKYAPRPGWHEWVEGQFQFSPQWATGLINAYEKFGASTEVEALPAKVILALSGPNVPQVAIDDVVARVNNGGAVTEWQARQIARAAKALLAQRTQQNHAARIAKISTNSTALPAGQRFPVIYGDPPWKYGALSMPAHGRNLRPERSRDCDRRRRAVFVGYRAAPARCFPRHRSLGLRVRHKHGLGEKWDIARPLGP
jgi:hypothetical protein